MQHFLNEVQFIWSICWYVKCISCL